MIALVTGFEPFGGETVNPALDAVMALPQAIAGAEIAKLRLPTVFGKSTELLEREIERLRPDVLLSVGQAGGRNAITVERVAINVDDASIDDNDGNRPVDRTIHGDGLPGYFSTLPIKEIVRVLRDDGIPAAVSDSAGTFVCNHVFYHVLYLVNTRYPAMRAGFVHVPYSTAQAVGKNAPSMSPADIARAVELAVETAVKSFL